MSTLFEIMAKANLSSRENVRWILRKWKEKNVPREHETSGTGKDSKSLITRPVRVGQNTVDPESERDSKDGQAKNVQTVRQSGRKDLDSPKV